MHQSILVHHKSHADQSLFEFQKSQNFKNELNLDYRLSIRYLSMSELTL